MEAYSHLHRGRGRTGHVPQIKSGVLCLGGDSYPRCAVVGAVINVDGVAAGIFSAPVDCFGSARSSRILRLWACGG